MGFFDYWKRPRKVLFPFSLFAKLEATPKPTDLTHTSRFKGKWVCLDEKHRVCGVGSTTQEALDDAEKKNYRMPTIMFVMKEPFNYGQKKT